MEGRQGKDPGGKITTDAPGVPGGKKGGEYLRPVPVFKQFPGAGDAHLRHRRGRHKVYEPTRAERRSAQAYIWIRMGS